MHRIKWKQKKLYFAEFSCRFVEDDVAWWGRRAGGIPPLHLQLTRHQTRDPGNQNKHIYMILNWAWGLNQTVLLCDFCPLPNTILVFDGYIDISL